MNARDVFGYLGDESIGIEYLLGDYWRFEMMLSDAHGWAYSFIADSQDPSERTCGICGTVCGTDTHGRNPRVCENKQCQQVREFFSINNEVAYPRYWNKFSLKAKTTRAKRASFLKRKISEIPMAKRLIDIDESILFEFLLNAMIERIAYENKAHH